MNILLIGSGGREHALALKIAESPNCDKLYISPGNPGTAQVGENISLDLKNIPEVVEFCNFNKVKFVVIGPEQPLVDGLADDLRQNHLIVFGPGQNGARLEGDKEFAKHFLVSSGIPTAEYRSFSKSDYGSALKYLGYSKFPIVIKATGLAAGKGVMICNDLVEAVTAMEDCFHNNIFGDAGNTVVIEEFLKGEEASVFVITDGKDYQILPASQDHKRIGDNDEGKNTGGMGAYAPAPIVSEFAMKCVDIEIVQPTLDSLKSKNIDYRGCIYIGLMITKEGPKVIEYNCRFGDPEIQAVLPLLKGDFLELLYSASIGKLNKECCQYKEGAAVCVVTASGGYPASYKKGFVIEGLENALEEGIIVYHAGTKSQAGKIVTNGGRVLGVTAFCDKTDITLCKEKAYRAISKIKYEGIYFRKDISDKAFKKTPFV